MGVKFSTGKATQGGGVRRGVRAEVVGGKGVRSCGHTVFWLLLLPDTAVFWAQTGPSGAAKSLWIT